jgi:hypothetical protein
MGRGRSGVIVPEEEGGDKRIHFGIHVEHAVEIVRSQVEHPNQTAIHHGGSELKDAIRLLIFQQLMQTVLDDIAVFVVLQLAKHDVYQL